MFENIDFYREFYVVVNASLRHQMYCIHHSALTNWSMANNFRWRRTKRGKTSPDYWASVRHHPPRTPCASTTQRTYSRTSATLTAAESTLSPLSTRLKPLQRKRAASPTVILPQVSYLYNPVWFHYTTSLWRVLMSAIELANYWFHGSVYIAYDITASGQRSFLLTRYIVAELLFPQFMYIHNQTKPTGARLFVCFRISL